MMTLKTLARNILITAILVAPSFASAQDYRDDQRSYRDDSRGYQHDSRAYYSHGHRYYRHDHYRTCGADERRRANNGTAIGAVSGGVLGATLGGGIGNTLLGAGAGAVAGHEIGKHTTRC